MENLASKYRPRVLEDIVEQDIVVDILKKMSASENLTCRCFLFIGPAGTGKAQPLDSKILTPNGYIAMKDVQIGTEIFTHTGRVGKVSGIYPQGIRPIYEITLQDKTKIRVSDEHLNVVHRYNEDKKCREDFCLTTTELIKLFESSRFKLRVDTPSVDWGYVKLPVDPYLLGALIGDGSLSNDNFQFSNGEEDVINKVDSILRRDWNMTLKKCPGDNVDYSIVPVDIARHKYSFRYKNVQYDGIAAMQDVLVSEGYPMFDSNTIINIANNRASTTFKLYPELISSVTLTINDSYGKNELKHTLKNLGLLVKSVDKHIPTEYLHASKIQRLDLLRGLYDTDGTTSKDGATIFNTSSSKLSEDFAFLVRSLGIRDTVSTKKSQYSHRGDSSKIICNDSFEHYLHVPNELTICSSDKHWSRRTLRQNPPIRNIVSIEYVGNEECQCIMIDHPDHTYISDDFIPTHNTTTSRALATLWNKGANGVIEIDAASNNGVDAMREIVQQASIYPVNSEYKIFIIDEVHVLSQQAWQVLLKTLEEQPARSIFFLCLTGDGLVPTKKGLKRLDEIVVGDMVWDGESYRKVTNTFDKGIADCISINIQDGTSIKCTPEHEIEVLDGDQIVWKKAKDIVVGDSILEYNNFTNYDKCNNISLHESWFLGYLTGNGNYTDHSMNIYTPYHKWELVKSHLDALIEENIIKDYIVDSDIRALSNNIHDTRIHFYSDKYHPGMTDWYRKVGAFPSYTRGNKKIPEIVYSMDESLVRAFVDGWYAADGDGQYSSFFSDEKYANPQIYCSNYSMISNLQNILRSIGIYSTIHKQTNVITEEYFEKNSFIAPGEYVSYSIYIRKGAGRFHNHRFRQILLDHYRSITKGSGKYKLELSELQKKERRISPRMITESGYDYMQKGRFFNVKSIEHIGDHHVYDIEVENSHKFVYNGVVVHNCTTNPEKIPATILSRVQTFQLSKISLKGIHDRLKFVLDSEIAEGRKITYTDDAITYIAKLANGGMRDALTTLDKALAFSEDIKIENLELALSLPNFNDYFDLLNAIVRKNNEKIIKMINDVYNSGVNFVKWFEGFHSFLCNIVKYIFLRDISLTMIPSTYEDKISGYGPNHSAWCLQLSNKLVRLIADLKRTQYLQEYAITYLCDSSKKENK